MVDRFDKFEGVGTLNYGLLCLYSDYYDKYRIIFYNIPFIAFGFTLMTEW